MRFFTVLTLLAAMSGPISAQSPVLGGCAIFPADNVWNTPIDTLPVDANSAAYVASMNATNTMLHPDFGNGTPATGGIPYNLVPGSQPKVTVPFYYGGDPGPYPIPDNVYIESGSDHHAIMIDTSTCELYEIFNLTGGPGSWAAGSGATWSLNSDALRPNALTSADAAGLPILPGLVRYDELVSGSINHAIRVTADHTRSAHIWPARHDASSLTDTQYPPMGQRFRLKASYDISGFSTHVQTLLQALKTYGMILADNGISWHISGVGDPRWDDTEMHALTQVTGDNFEAIDESSLMVDPNSGATSGGGGTPLPPPPPPGTIPTGWVNVINQNSGLCLGIKGGPAATWRGDTAQQWACLGAVQTNQQFQLTPVSGGYEITVRNSGLAIQPTGGDSSYEGSLIEQWPFIGADYQTWNVISNANGYFTIRQANDTRDCLSISRGSTLNGAPAHLWACTGRTNQSWELVPIS
ncbi:MAG: RICIN domain-containing protein [Acidobacteriota bacterium]|nr:RICIN domain-containing protein [Acidobacteriota bacterium]